VRADEAGPDGPTAEHHPGEEPRPPFARRFPRDAELDRLVALFARGNHAAVRVGARALAAKTTDRRVAAAARELSRRLSPDPIASVLLGGTFLLLCFLTGWAIVRSRALERTPPPVPPPPSEAVRK
jgi:hypothetical protein